MLNISYLVRSISHDCISNNIYPDICIIDKTDDGGNSFCKHIFVVVIHHWHPWCIQIGILQIFGRSLFAYICCLYHRAKSFVRLKSEMLAAIFNIFIDFFRYSCSFGWWWNSINFLEDNFDTNSVIGLINSGFFL